MSDAKYDVRKVGGFVLTCSKTHLKFEYPGSPNKCIVAIQGLCIDPSNDASIKFYNGNFSKTFPMGCGAFELADIIFEMIAARAT
jgi:hypothetical protein